MAFLFRPLFRRTTLLIMGLSAFLAGIGLARTGITVSAALVGLLLAGVAVTYSRRNFFGVLFVILFAASLGLLRGGLFLRHMQPFRELAGQPVVFTATVQSDAVYGYQGQLSFDVHDIRFSEPMKSRVPGRIAVRGLGENAVYRGDKVRVEGTLLATRGSRQARTSFARISVVERGAAFTEAMRRSFVAGMGSALPEPQASFGLGLLLGYRTTLPERTNEALKKVGLTHIIAVSGYNLTVIVRAVRRSLRRWSKYQQLVISVALILLFLALTDFSASIVRAALVSGLSLLAWYFGRAFRPFLILLLSGAITAAWNPLYVWSDIGWYLSFLAFFGVLIVAPLFMRKCSHAAETERKFPISMLLAETTAAQLMTAPLALYIFNQTSVMSLLSNIIIGPLVPVVMVLALFAGIGGMLLPVLSGWIALPAQLLLTYMLDLVYLMARVPNALIEHSFSLHTMVASYVLIVLAVGWLWRQRSSKHGIITGIPIV